MENGEISPIYEIMLVKYIDLMTFGGGLLENKQIPYKGLVIEASNTKKCCVFLQNPTIATKRKYFWSKIYQNTNIYMDFSEISPKTLTLM